MKLTVAQEQAVTTTARRVCVRAGAGSGKTGVLISRIMHLIESGNAPLDQIVAITFTEKAALEMKTRLREACRERAPKDDPDKLTYWRTVERSVSSARITTIHAFCAGLLREHALHLGGDPDFVMLADADSHLLRHDATQEELLRQLQAGDEDAALVAAELGFEPTLNAMRSLLRSGSEVARAVSHMGDLSAAAVKQAWDELEQHTKRQALQYLRTDPRRMEIRDGLIALDGCCSDPDDPREQFRKSMIADLDGIESLNRYEVLPALLERLSGRPKNAKKKFWNPESAIKDVLTIRDDLKKMLSEYVWNPLPESDETTAIALTAAFLRVYARIAAAYDSAKLSRVSQDFDDLIIRAREILMNDPAIRNRVARSMSHLLIDEFQDTDGMQWDIAQCLNEIEDGPHLFVVGDAKQSIYLFRGAEVETFREAERTADDVILLDENFRSLPNVLEFVNAFFAETGRLANVEPQYGHLAAHRTRNSTAQVEFVIPNPVEEKTSLAAFRLAEADILASRLKEMVDQDITIGARIDGAEVQRPVQYGDMAILLRAMSEVHIYEQSLRRYDIPFTVVSGAGFYERQEIRDLRNFLTVVADPSDEMALLAFLRSPLAGLSDDALTQAIGVIADEPTPLMRFVASDTALPDPEQQDRLTRARRLLDDTRTRREWSAPNLLRFILAETGYEAMLLHQDFLGEQRAINVRKLVALAESFSRSSNPGLVQFLRYLEDVAKTEIREGDALELSHDRDAVTIMTIHQSKGLEFPVVAIADAGRSATSKSDGTVARHRSLGIALRTTDEDDKYLEPAAWQCINRMRKWQDRAESARMLYVAMTRARDYLLIGGPVEGGRSADTWMKGFDRWLDLSNFGNGDAMSRTDWKGTVWRTPRSAPAAASKRATPPPLDATMVRRRIASVPSSPKFREVTITTLATLLAASDTDKPSVEEPSSKGNPFAMTRGTAAHRLLQLWDFERDATPPMAALLHGTPLDAAARTQLSNDLETIIARFRESSIFESLRAEPTVEREQQIRWLLDGMCINGVIDARMANGTIVDYKTGAQHSSLDTQYQWQLRLYAAAIRALTGSLPPKGMLCYLDQDGAPCTEVQFDSATIDETENRLRALTLEAL